MNHSVVMLLLLTCSDCRTSQEPRLTSTQQLLAQFSSDVFFLFFSDGERDLKKLGLLVSHRFHEELVRHREKS